MAKIPTSLLALRMDRLEVTEYVARALLRDQLRRTGRAPAELHRYAEQAGRHFAAHRPFGIPAPEMTAALDLFFNPLAAELGTDPSVTET
ncbi:MAG TPA: hypothetical protein VFG12_03460 [Rhodopila sp.]|nr:hypothetical protein [Rhodopila sp.]